MRHGQTDWNLTRRYMGASDRPLTEHGRRQATSLGRFFVARKIDVIVHSGVARTRDTAEAICAGRKIDLIEDARWREASHGVWEGLTWREVSAHFGAQARARFSDPLNVAPPDGESLTQLRARVLDAYSDLGQSYPRKRVLIATHGGVIQTLLCELFATPLAEHWRWRIDLGSASGFDCYPGATILRAVNSIPPLVSQRIDSDESISHHNSPSQNTPCPSSKPSDSSP